MPERKIRVVIGKPGLDGHDRGAKMIAFALRDAGMEVIYTGLHQTVEAIAHTAMQEDADVIGLSIMSGVHLPICQKLMNLIKEKHMEDILVVIGGVIPVRDIPKLKDMGVKGVFPGGTRFEDAVNFIREHVKR
jgi:methylmalonyl-CoA mutase C-terminal domain/subunit